MKNKVFLLLLALVVIATAVYLARGRNAAVGDGNELRLSGHVELRQVALAFNASERIAAVLVEEGETVRKGQVLARVDTARLTPQEAQARATVAAQREVVARLRSGSRPEEIAQARATVAALKAEATDAERRRARLETINKADGASLQELQAAETTALATQARLEAAQRALDLFIAGPRPEDLREAEARLQAAEAQAALLRQQLAEAQLLAPEDGVVRTRVLEPGEMASPQRPVLTLSLTHPKWIRTWIEEPRLSTVRPGLPARVAADGLGVAAIEGVVSFVSPNAEFTPRTIQTEELRTHLVYEVRVRVEDPRDTLRLGMPVTVTLALPKAPAPAQSATPAKP